MTTITSANSTFALTAVGVFSSPQSLAQYGPDALFEPEEVTSGEFVMGADGVLSMGWTPYMVVQSVTLMPNSPSCSIFDQIIAAEAQQREKIVLTATVTLPAIGQKYSFAVGGLARFTPFAPAGKVLKERKFTMHFGQFSAGAA